MKTSPVTLDDLTRSVLAVPPLARDKKLRLAAEENKKLIGHLEAGGVSTILYGGNANLYHISQGEFRLLLGALPAWVSADTWVIPSIGPMYGPMLEQIDVVKSTGYPTAMILPLSFPTTPDGVATGLRHAAERLERAIVLYLKSEDYLTIPLVRSLVDDGLICAIKYAVVRQDPRVDPYLEALLDQVDHRLVVSGIGERPAIVHLADFGVCSFTSGSVCVAPRQSTALLRCLQQGQREAAERLRESFLPLEDLRDGISPIRVLHDAVTAAGVADMGPILPLLSNLDGDELARVRNVARSLLQAEAVVA
jgi:dihydrodipicolinate synthase/N-acetylneuraminate lyase